MINLTLLILGFSAVVLAAGFVYTRWWVYKTAQTFPPKGAFVEAGGVRMHYVRKGKGRPVVLIHGSFATHHYYRLSIFEPLSNEFDVIAFDQPGYGHSGRPKKAMTLETHAEYLHEALGALGIEKPLIVAHSWGAGVALAYAVKYPGEASGLVLLSGYVKPSNAPVEVIYRLPTYQVVRQIFLNCLLTPTGAYMAPYRTRKSFAPNPVNETYASIITAFALRPKSFDHNAEDVRHCSPSLRRLMPRFGEIRIPVYLLTGDKDTVTYKEIHFDWLKTMIPAAQTVVFPDTGHMIPFAWPDNTVEIIRKAAGQEQEGAA